MPAVFHRLRSLWRNLIRRRRADADLDAELRSHLDLLIDEGTRAGLAPDAARRRAFVALEGMTQVREAVREMRSGAWIESVRRDVGLGVRIMRRRPLASGTAIVALALGIGATTSVFSVVNAVLLRPLPYADPDRLAVILHDGQGPVSPANYLDWKAQTESFAGMGAAEYWRPALTGGDAAEKLYALRVTPDIFPLLGIGPAIGHWLHPADDGTAMAEPEVVLSHRLWQRRFDGDPAVLGRIVRLDDQAYTVVGVMPPDFVFAPFWATKAELWAPLALGARAHNRGDESLRVFARLRTDVTFEEARADVATVTDRLERRFAGSNRNIQVVPLGERVFGNVRPALLLLLTAVGFVLLMTCANLAHMMLAHGATRQREFGMRLALGASTPRLVRQILTESTVLVAAGGLAGLGLAMWGVDLLRTLGPADLPRLGTVAIDRQAVVFAVTVSALAGVLFSLVPAFRASRSAVAGTVRPHGAARGHRGRSALVATEFGLAMMLLAGAGLTIRSFLQIAAIDPGFHPARVASMTASVIGAAVGQTGRRASFFQEAIERVRAVPGVESASAINHLPIAGDLWGLTFRVEGRPEPAEGEAPTATYRVVLPGYFATMGLPLVGGRDIATTDALGSEPVVIVNEYFARRHWPDQDPLGKRIALRGGTGGPRWMRVIGIARDAIRGEWLEKHAEEMYVPYLQTSNYLASPASHFSYLTIVFRTHGDPDAVIPGIRRAIWGIDPNVPISDVQTMQAVVDAATAVPRFYLILFTVFAVAAILLAAVGVYGVMSVAVAERRREIGIRLALGARPERVVRLILGGGLRMAFAGIVLGLVGALLVSGAMASLVYGIAPNDPATLAGVVVILAVVAFAASYLPARRATRADTLAHLWNE